MSSWWGKKQGLIRCDPKMAECKLKQKCARWVLNMNAAERRDKQTTFDDFSSGAANSVAAHLPGSKHKCGWYEGK